MAAGSECLELTRLLLQKSPSLYDKGEMHRALDTFLDRAYNPKGIGKGPNFQLVDAVYSLFIGEYGLSFDLTDEDRFRHGFNLFLTKKTAKLIMENRDIPLADLAPAQRFSELVESHGLPADTFATLLYHRSSGNPATKRDSSGKTALHWAAGHFGEWFLRSQSVHPDIDPSSRAESYKKLASKLITAGADLHALWRQVPVTSTSPRIIGCHCSIHSCRF